MRQLNGLFLPTANSEGESNPKEEDGEGCISVHSYTHTHTHTHSIYKHTDQTYSSAPPVLEMRRTLENVVPEAIFPYRSGLVCCYHH